MKDTEIGWVAGIMDGEGTITLTNTTHPKSKPFRTPLLSVTSTDLEILNELRRLIGGNIVVVKRTGHFKPTWHWKRKGAQIIVSILTMIEPAMKCPLKKARANHIIHNWNSITHPQGRYSTAQIKRKYQFEDEFFKLK